MNFLAPAAFALSLLLPIIVLMYLLKLRRVERQVSSVYLWQRMVRDVEANAPWQRLRRNLLLILQLLFLLALIFSLARPFTWAEGASGEAAILILDTSASMGATDIAPTRLEAAKAQARRLVDNLPDSARVTVIAAGAEAQVLLSSSQDRRQAHLALERVALGTGSSNIGVALELASAIAARQPNTEIIVLSDGRVELPERLALKGRLSYLPLGIRGENQAISLLTLEEGAAGGSLTAFAQVSNYGTDDVERRLSLYADGQLVNVFDIEIPAGGQRAVLAEDIPAETALVEAHLEAPAQPDLDILPTDDRALSVRREAKPLRVTLVTEGNLFLQTALRLLPGVELTLVEPTEDLSLSEADLTVLDAYVPEEGPLPSGNLLFVAPPRSSAYFTTTGLVEAPQVRPADSGDPLLEHVSLSGVSVLDAVRIPLPLWARSLVAGDTQDGSIPLLFYGQTDGRRVAVLAFDLRRSDLPLHTAFPILWANLVHWLAPGSAGTIPAQVAPGESLSFNLPPEVESVTLTRPDGARTRLQPEAGRIGLVDLQQLGLYTLEWQESGEARSASFTVNLFSPQESDLAPADALPGLEAGEGDAAAEQGGGRREWWRPVALFSLVVLTLEWMVYQRAALARLKDDMKRLVGI